ncbi:N-acetyltransferase [Sphingosinicella sp. BN140058]|nr:GNAT family N-acetyltransferase [Sphingosinicella sp. BN140058]QAY79699.1 N-acetyltransferase [Sphingosinicella sp. BN140058]
MRTIGGTAPTSPTLADWRAELTTRGGVRVDVRPAAHEDEAALAEFFTHVTNEDLRFRFLTSMPRPAKALVAALVDVDHSQTENLLAFETTSGVLVATAMIAADSRFKSAEVAIAIHSDYKQKGLGWALLDHAAAYAKARGIKMIHSIESRDNRQAIAVERDLGFEASLYEGDATLVRLSKRLD